MVGLGWYVLCVGNYWEMFEVGIERLCERVLHLAQRCRQV